MIELEWNHTIQATKDPGFSVEPIPNLFFRRWVRVIRDPAAGPADRVKALQDALRCARSHGILTPSLEVRHLDLPTDLLKQAGIRVESLKGRAYLIDTDLPSPLKDTYQGVQRRHLSRFSMDAALTAAMGEAAFETYMGRGQQAAIQWTLAAEPGSTLVVQLPTGSGKSTIIHALATTLARDQMVLVVVPTIGLAIEQAQRARRILDQAQGNLLGVDALHGGLDEGTRRGIRERMDQGVQKLLFCSPESAMGSLMPALFRAAKRGWLGALVVDEAHLIDGWGDEFRPQFQLLSPLFRSLQEQSPVGIQKVLMSATLAPHVMEVLRALFQEEGRPFLEVNGSYLRPEISFQPIRVVDDQHRDRVLKALWEMPRPLLLYVTSPDDAEGWYTDLREAGFMRVQRFHGNTPPESRRAILERWNRDELDIMVATSAFGVGMDKGDVRSVLHAMVPENLDRYYQEAGRGGRDGLASLSWIVWTERQMDAASWLNRNKLIREEKGLLRWRAMLNTAIRRSDGHWTFDVSRRRIGLERWSPANRDWNWRTILLMQRAGMVRLRFLPPEPPGELSETPEGSDARNAYFEHYFDQVDVEITHGGTLSSEDWKKVIGLRRGRERRSREAGFFALSRWLRDPGSPLCEILLGFYAGDGPQPQLACGGCPGCRAKGREPFTPTLGQICNVQQSTTPRGIELEGHLGTTTKVRYQPGQVSIQALLRGWRPWIQQLLQSKRIQAIRGKRDTLDRVATLLPPGSTPFWISLDSRDPDSSWAELVLVTPDHEDPTPVQWPNPRIQERIIVAPADRRHDFLPHRQWWQEGNSCHELEDFSRSL